jgi:hypothetical protein
MGPGQAAAMPAWREEQRGSLTHQIARPLILGGSINSLAEKGDMTPTGEMSSTFHSLIIKKKQANFQVKYVCDH